MEPTCRNSGCCSKVEYGSVVCLPSRLLLELGQNLMNHFPSYFKTFGRRRSFRRIPQGTALFLVGLPTSLCGLGSQSAWRLQKYRCPFVSLQHHAGQIVDFLNQLHSRHLRRFGIRKSCPLQYTCRNNYLGITRWHDTSVMPRPFAAS